jgi:hypothetical protein
VHTDIRGEYQQGLLTATLKHDTTRHFITSLDKKKDQRKRERHSHPTTGRLHLRRATIPQEYGKSTLARRID